MMRHGFAEHSCLASSFVGWPLRPQDSPEHEIEVWRQLRAWQIPNLVGPLSEQQSKLALSSLRLLLHYSCS